MYIAAVFTGCVGVYHDDGIYLVSAKALAEGRGYRIISLPGDPRQTKYPPLFPLILSCVWRITPAFPANIPWLKVVPTVFFFGWAAATHSLLGMIGAGKPWARWIVITTIASPAWLYFGTSLMTEAPFAFLATLGLMALIRASRDDESRLLWPIAAGLLCAAAFLTRTIGFTLIGAGILTLGVSRKWRSTAIFAAIAGFAMAAWLVWALPSAGSPDPYYSASNYESWHVFSKRFSGHAFEIMIVNALWIAAAPLPMIGAPAHWAAFLGLAPFHVFAFLGMRRTQNALALKLWLALYTGLVLLWVSPPMRFLLPFLPVWLYFVAQGMIHAGPRGQVAFACVILGMLGCATAGSIVKTMRGRTHECVGTFYEWKPLVSVLERLSRDEPKDAVFSGNLDPLYYLFTGRKSIRAFEADPYLLHYAQRGEPLGSRAEFMERLDRSHVTHVLSHECKLYTEAPILERMEQATIGASPGWTKIVAEPQVTVYKRDGPISTAGDITTPFGRGSETVMLNRDR
jgi:hypothetical protein